MHGFQTKREKKQTNKKQKKAGPSAHKDESFRKMKIATVSDCAAIITFAE